MKPRIIGYHVMTIPPGQTPARVLARFKRLRDAREFARRERYLQIVPRRSRA